MIEIGSDVPRRRRPVLKAIGSGMLRLMRWKVGGRIANEPKFVMTGGPHTSNWDFVVALMTLWALELDVHWIGKHTIFRWPFGSMFRAFGGIPVDRSKPGTLYRDVLHGFEKRAGFVFALSPEGTRSKVKRLKPGFHRIAVKAGVPLIAAGVDFGSKTIFFSEPIYPTGDFEMDSAALMEFWRTCTPRYPELF